MKMEIQIFKIYIIQNIQYIEMYFINLFNLHIKINLMKSLID